MANRFGVRCGHKTRSIEFVAECFLYVGAIVFMLPHFGNLVWPQDRVQLPFEQWLQVLRFLSKCSKCKRMGVDAGTCRVEVCPQYRMK